MCFTLLYSYANRAKDIKNKPKINEDPKDALLREFQEEIARLKSQLGGKGGKKGGKKKRRTRRGPDGKLPQTGSIVHNCTLSFGNKVAWDLLPLVCTYCV